MLIYNIKNCSKFIFPVLIILGFLSSCRNHEFKIKGEVYGAENMTMALEKPDFQGFWQVVDSIHINRNGGFSFTFPTPSSPEIFRLALNDQFIYFPVDSTETITINTSLDKFGQDFSLAGSLNATKLEQFEKELQSIKNTHPDSLATFKRNVYSNYMKDAPGSILSFYILTKTVDGKPLYDPTDSQDRKYFGAVATGYKTVRPEDPHTAILEQTALNALKLKNKEKGNFLQIEANELVMIDMDLPNEYGENVKLSDVTGHGKSVVVIFSLLNHPDSPQLNIDLANIYERVKNNVEFYHVSLDADQYAWREAAKNLPWITVYSPGQNESAEAIRYNVFQIPSFYIYNREGELTSRPLTIAELNKSL